MMQTMMTLRAVCLALFIVLTLSVAGQAQVARSLTTESGMIQNVTGGDTLNFGGTARFKYVFVQDRGMLQLEGGEINTVTASGKSEVVVRGGAVGRIKATGSSRILFQGRMIAAELTASDTESRTYTVTVETVLNRIMTVTVVDYTPARETTPVFTFTL